jgi:hypothetical protein
MGIEREELLRRCEQLVHGTTRGMNAILTGHVARTAFLTTKGHPDVLVLREGGRDRFNFVEESVLAPVEAGTAIRASATRPASSGISAKAGSVTRRPKRGRAGTMTHDSKRNGTTTLFAALDLLDGTVHRRVPCPSPPPGVPRLPARLDRTYPAELELHFTPTVRPG